MKTPLFGSAFRMGATLDLRSNGAPPQPTYIDFGKLAAAARGVARSHMKGPGGKVHNRADLCLRKF